MKYVYIQTYDRALTFESESTDPNVLKQIALGLKFDNPPNLIYSRIEIELEPGNEVCDWDY